MPLQPGTVVGFYDISAQIGAGGMGEVYRAHDTRLKREVALKLIRPSLVDQRDIVDRFLQEAVLLSSLNHPNIVTIYETGVVESDRYIAMELIHGSTVRELIRDGLSIDRVSAIGRQIAQALAVAHAAQIVHRDVKPENLMVRTDGYVKILDFGLARFSADTASRATGAPTTTTTPGVVLGTAAYLSPEQVRCEPLTPASDIFALGIVLYELLAGRHPFEAPSSVGLIHALVSELPEPPSALNPDVPPALDALVLDALQKEPAMRPTAAELADRLATHGAQRSQVAAGSSPVDRKIMAPVVGREPEIEILLQELDRARAGTARIVAISGEAGIGKTTLVEAFLAELSRRGDPVRVGRGRCSERLAGTEAYLPVLELLDSLQRDTSLGSLSRLTRALAPSWYVQIAPASREGSSGARLVAETSTGSQERLKREIGALLEEAARRQPLILFFDDVQWADPSTMDLLAYLARRLEAARVLLVLTARPSVLAQSRHAFLHLKHDLIARGVCRDLWPGSLDRAAVARYLALQFPGHAFPDAFCQVIHGRTEGHPLFMADALRDLRRRDVLRQRDGRWTLMASPTDVHGGLPESVRSLVQRKMDALDAQDRQLLGTAAVQGVDFDTAVLAGALGLSDEEIEQRCERLEREHALVRFVSEWEYPDRTLTLRYRFAHHVYHNACYESLRITRRVASSRAVANVLVARLADRTKDRASDLALLYETAREGVRAAEYFSFAAQSASRRYAHDETRRLAERGLAALEREPPATGGGTARAAAELDLHMILGLAIRTGSGYGMPDVGRAYARARQLCHELNDPQRVVPTLIGLAAHYAGAGEIEASRDIGVEMLGLFDRLGDPHLQMLGEWALGAALFHLGDLREAHRHIARGLELYDPAFHGPRVWETGLEPGLFCRCEAARLQCLLGAPDAAVASVRAIVSDARALGHPQTLAFTLLFAGFVHHERREWEAMRLVLEEALSLCQAKGIAQEALWAEPLLGMALFELGEAPSGLSQMEAGLAAIARTDSVLLKPFYLNAKASMLIRARRLDDAEAMLLESEESARVMRQHAYDAERHRVWGELEAARGETAAAERRLRDAVTIAERQGASWPQFRAAASLASWLVEEGRTGEAAEALASALALLDAGESAVEVAAARALAESITPALRGHASR